MSDSGLPAKRIHAAHTEPSPAKKARPAEEEKRKPDPATENGNEDEDWEPDVQEESDEGELPLYSDEFEHSEDEFDLEDYIRFRQMESRAEEDNPDLCSGSESDEEQTSEVNSSGSEETD